MNPYSYENKIRPNFELRAVAVWLVTILIAVYKLIMGQGLVYLGVAAFAILMMIMWTPKAFMLLRLRRRMKGEKVALISAKKLRKIMKGHKDSIWLGLGYAWEPSHSQDVQDILKQNSKYLPKARDKNGIGMPWIHGLSRYNKKPITYLQEHASLHTLIVGTTGSGKTRQFDLLITQAILRGECVIIIDPKGDKELKENAKYACELAGKPELFSYFHPGFPEQSVRLDPLFNFNSPSELATRIANLVETVGEDPFKNFAQMALNSIIQGHYLSKTRATLVSIRKYFDKGPEELVIRAIGHYAAYKLDSDWKQISSGYTKNAKTQKQLCDGMVRFYREVVAPDHASPDLEGLISIHEHEREHFSKMITSILPKLNMLTSGDLGELLSPDGTNNEDKRIITNSRRVVESEGVLYIGLDSLSNSMTGQAIGSLFLADFASVAGDRYNYGADLKPVNIFIDEAAEVVNEQLIQLLNKGRGAKVRMILATQTIADLETKLGSVERARMVLGNVNTIIALRTTDVGSQEFLTNKILKTQTTTVMRTQGTNTSGNPALHSANVGERYMEAEADRIQPAILGYLPNLEFFSITAGGALSKGKLPVLINDDMKKAA